MNKVRKWGLPVPKEILHAKGHPRSYWGARATFRYQSRNPIELLHNRQYFEPDEVIYPLIYSWIQEKGLPWLREKLKDVAEPDESEFFRLDQSIYGIIGRVYGRHVHIGAWRYDTDQYKFELSKPAPGAKWSGNFPVPEPGDRVRVMINGFGLGTVIDYSVGEGFLGVRVRPDKLPIWFIKQNPYTSTGTFYGAELALPNRRR